MQQQLLSHLEACNIEYMAASVESLHIRAGTDLESLE
jgi:hypothetical protein